MKPALLNEYEFKGARLQPFSKGRLTMAQAAGVRFSGEFTASAKDALAIIFLCVCDYKIRSLAQTDPPMFWEKLEEWENTFDGPEDYKAAGELAQVLLEGVISTKAEPLDSTDLSQAPDPLPN